MQLILASYGPLINEEKQRVQKPKIIEMPFRKPLKNQRRGSSEVHLRKPLKKKRKGSSSIVTINSIRNNKEHPVESSSSSVHKTLRSSGKFTGAIRKLTICEVSCLLCSTHRPLEDVALYL